MAKQLKLEDMKLADLQAKYKEVTGKSNKSPNKKFFIKAIQEAEAGKKNDAPTGRRAQIATAARGRTPRAQAGEEASGVAPPPAQDASDAGSSAEEPAPQGAASPMPEAEAGALEGDATEPVGDQVVAAAAEPAGAEVEDELEPASDVADEADEVEEPSAASGDTDGGDGKGQVSDASSGATPPTNGVNKKQLAKLTVEELQKLYAETVKRPTGSTNKTYLAWKIDQVAKGRVPAGPARRSAGTGSRAARRFTDVTTGELQKQYEEKTGTATESLDREFLVAGIVAAGKTHGAASSKRYGSTKAFQVVPFGLKTPVVEGMDAAWDRHRYKNRLTFLKEAVREKLLKLGEDDAAVMFNA